MDNMSEDTQEEIKLVKKPEINIASAIVIAGIIIGGAIFITRGQAADTTVSGSADKLDLVERVSDVDRIRGNVDAPITVIEYADFSCHYCAQYHPTMKRLVAEEGDKVRWVYRDLPIFNKEAARAGVCVDKLGGDEAFWNFSDTLFANQDKFTTEYYQTVAVSSGITASDYSSCVADPVLKAKIDQDFASERILLGFSATPYTVIIDKTGRKFSFAGALSYDELKSVIDGLGR
jgi:protein-disulfide isomerase